MLQAGLWSGVGGLPYVLDALFWAVCVALGVLAAYAGVLDSTVSGSQLSSTIRLIDLTAPTRLPSTKLYEVKKFGNRCEQFL